MKAKTVKGSARTKKFARGGDIAAGLAGLGTLAYLMSKKKDDEKPSTTTAAAKEESAPEPKELKKLGKYESEAGDGTSKGDTNDKAYEPIKAEPMARAKPEGKKPPVFIPGRIGSMDAGIPKESKGEKVGAGYEGLDLREKPASTESKRKEESKEKPTGGAAAGSASGKAKPEKSKLTNTFLTKERTDKARSAYYQGFKKGLFEKGDLGIGKKSGGAVKKYASGGSVSSASKRADGIAQRGKTRGKVC